MVLEHFVKRIPASQQGRTTSRKNAFLHGTAQRVGCTPGQFFAGFWSPIATITAVAPGAVTAEVEPSYALERGDIDASLNFIIPPEDMWGQLRMRIEVSGGSHSDDKTIDIDATLKQTMRIAGIMVGYSGPNAAGTADIDLPAPGLADLQNTSPWTLTIYPVSEATFRVVSTITQDEPLTDPALCDGWNRPPCFRC